MNFHPLQTCYHTHILIEIIRACVKFFFQFQIIQKFDVEFTHKISTYHSYGPRNVRDSWFTLFVLGK